MATCVAVPLDGKVQTVTKKLMSVALVPARMEALAQYVDVSRVSKLEKLRIHILMLQDQFNGYMCNCTPGWEGTNCDQEIDECSSGPCKNGGTCIVC